LGLLALKNCLKFSLLNKSSPNKHGTGKDKKGVLLDSENGSYGTGGIFRAKNFTETNTGKVRSGMGFHAGRANKKFFERITEGCFRLEKEFFNDIETAIQKYGPLQKAVIYQNSESGHSNESKEIFEKLHPFIDSPIRKNNDTQQPNLNTTA